MITHVIVELEYPIEECWMRDYSDEYYGIGRPLTMCKDCKFNDDSLCTWHSGRDNKWVVDDDDFCSVGKRDEE